MAGVVTPIVALDVPTVSAALDLAARLRPACRFFKVGSELFTAAGPAIVRALRDAGDEVFLDLKLHDIPNTVGAAARSAAGIGANMLTVHLSGGDRMLEAAVAGAGATCRVMGVTVLTSLGTAELRAAWGRRDEVVISDEVMRLSGRAASAGLHGIVCSGEEAARIRAEHGESLQPLVPGIRFSEGDRNDQARVVTPEQAIAAGARYLVLGRAVTAAADPVDAMRVVHDAIARASRHEVSANR